MEATEEPVSEDVTAWVFGPDVVADLKFAGKDASVTDESAGKADAATVIDGSDTADVFKGDAAAPGTISGAGAMDIVGEVLTTPGDQWGVDGASEGVQKITMLIIQPPAVGCDLTGDGVPDNTFSAVGPMMNGNIMGAILNGSLVILFNPSSWDATGKPFQFSILGGAPDYTAGKCDVTTAGCSYTVSSANFTGSPCNNACEAKSVVKSANLSGQMVGNAKLVTIPIQFGALLPIRLEALTFSGTVTTNDAWTSTTNGQMCGFVTTDNLLAAIDAVPDGIWYQTSMSKAQVKVLLPALMPADIDSDGDGVNDAISLAFGIQTKSGVITGIAN